MNKFNDLYDFIDFARSNRKYPENTANGLKSALKIFEKELNLDELNSIGLIEDNIDEIFINTVTNNKDKSISSLNTYKARFLKIIHDYQKYGIDPSKIQGWSTKLHKAVIAKTVKKDIPDKNIDKAQIALSDHANTPVHKIELSLRNDVKSIITIPKDISAKELKMIKTILDSLAMATEE